MEVRINCSDVEGRTPLILLCKFNNYGSSFLRCFEALNLRTDLNVAIQDNQGKTALHWLCYWNRQNATVEIIKRLLQRGIGINVLDRFGFNFLHCLFLKSPPVTQELLNVIHLLFSCGINAQAETHERYTALALLSRYGYGEKLVDAIQLLAMDYKIDPNRQTEHGSKAIHYLCQNPFLRSAEQFKAVVRLLASCGADVTVPDERGDTALTLLCRYSQITHLLDAVRFLVLDFQMDPNQQNQEGENALHSLCANQSETDGNLASVARFLIVDRGVLVNTKVNNGADTALHYLCCNGNRSSSSIGLLLFLIEKQISIQDRDSEGDNALHELCRNSESKHFLDFVRVLVEAGIDVKSRTLNGSTAVGILLEREDQVDNAYQIIQFLINC
jgi:ankyrin repeat protein